MHNNEKKKSLIIQVKIGCIIILCWVFLLHFVNMTSRLLIYTLFCPCLVQDIGHREFFGINCATSFN
jgi:hypothetical protein